MKYQVVNAVVIIKDGGTVSSMIPIIENIEKWWWCQNNEDAESKIDERQIIGR